MKKLSEIQKLTQTYLTDLKSFASSLKIDEDEYDDLDDIVNNVEELNNILSSLTNEINNDTQSVHFKLAKELANNVLAEIKYIKCKEKFIFEKADLIVGIFLIKEKTKEFI